MLIILFNMIIMLIILLLQSWFNTYRYVPGRRAPLVEAVRHHDVEDGAVEPRKPMRSEPPDPQLEPQITSLEKCKIS